VKILPVGAELFQADGRKDMTKLIVAFRNSVNAPKNWSGACWKKWRVGWRWAGEWKLLRSDAIMANTNQRLFPSRKITTSGSVKVKVSCV